MQKSRMHLNKNKKCQSSKGDWKIDYGQNKSFGGFQIIVNYHVCY